MTEHAQPGPHADHVASIRTYVLIYITLMVLLAATAGVYYVDLGVANAAVALFIAGIKATLVVLFFMHVKDSSRLTWVFASAGLLWFGIMMLLTLSDFATRGWMALSP